MLAFPHCPPISNGSFLLYAKVMASELQVAALESSTRRVAVQDKRVVPASLIFAAASCSSAAPTLRVHATKLRSAAAVCHGRHEVVHKHDGFRIIGRRNANGVRLFTRNGYNFAARFPGIAAAVESLSVQSCFIDGEAIVA